MKFYIGVTDMDWFRNLKTVGATEVNFWKPGTLGFYALDPGDLFLFKAKAKFGGKIIGGGFFDRYQRLSMESAWDVFGEKNGCASLIELKNRIMGYRTKNGMSSDESADIGCTILSKTFFLDETDWLDSPSDWKKFTVSGKTYDTTDPIGGEIYNRIMRLLSALGRN